MTKGRRQTTAEVNQRIAAQRIRLVGEWQTRRKQNQFVCLDCEHTWQAQGGGPLHAKSGCPKCHVFPFNQKLSTESVKARLAPRGIELIGEWQGSASFNTFRCALGHIWKTQGRSTLQDANDCPECTRLMAKNRHR